MRTKKRYVNDMVRGQVEAALLRRAFNAAVDAQSLFLTSRNVGVYVYYALPRGEQIVGDVKVLPDNVYPDDDLRLLSPTRCDPSASIDELKITILSLLQDVPIIGRHVWAENG